MSDTKEDTFCYFWKVWHFISILTSLLVYILPDVEPFQIKNNSHFQKYSVTMRTKLGKAKWTPRLKIVL